MTNPFDELTQAIEQDRAAADPHSAVNSAFRGVFTTPFAEPATVRKTIGLVTATVVRAAGIIGDIAIDLRDTFGGRSQKAESIIDVARWQALEILKENTARAGGNVVLNARVGVSEMGKNVFVVTAEGTAAIIDAK